MRASHQESCGVCHQVVCGCPKKPTEQKPEAGEVIQFEQGDTRFALRAQSYGSWPWHFRDATIADLAAAGYVPAASLAAAEAEYTKTERLWKAKAVELEAAKSDAERGWNEVHGLQAELGQLNQQLASERAGRERLQMRVAELERMAQQFTALKAIWDGDSDVDATDWYEFCRSFDWASTPAPPSEGPKLDFVLVQRVDELSRALDNWERVNGDVSGLVGAARRLRTAWGYLKEASEGPASPVAEDYSRFDLMSALAYDAIFRISSTLTADQAGRSRAELVLKWQALRSQPTPTGESPRRPECPHGVGLCTSSCPSKAPVAPAAEGEQPAWCPTCNGAKEHRRMLLGAHNNREALYCTDEWHDEPPPASPPAKEPRQLCLSHARPDCHECWLDEDAGGEKPRFAVGQPVRVTAGDLTGSCGTVLEFEAGRTWPYAVTLKNGYVRRFVEESLEPAPPQPPPPGQGPTEALRSQFIDAFCSAEHLLVQGKTHDALGRLSTAVAKLAQSLGVGALADELAKGAK